jgi:ABC-2 type transport system ATP-binding protein
MHDSIAAPETALTATHLSLRYGPVTVLDDVDFSLPTGAVLGVVGRNGAGKSTLLQCLLGLSAPQGGHSAVFGCPSLALTDAVKARLGYVAQSPELFDWLRVREQIALVGKLYPNWSEVRSEALCLRFDLPQDLRVSKLSLGEKQRLAIVLALAHQPDLLVFDEPVASLDPISRRDFLRALFDTDRDDEKPVTVVISSHLLDDLERVVTHLLFLDRGRLQLMGTRDELAEQIRVVLTEVVIDAQAGVLRSQQLGDGTWQSVIDLRAFPATALPPNAGLQARGLADLFVALNS